MGGELMGRKKVSERMKGEGNGMEMILGIEPVQKCLYHKTFVSFMFTVASSMSRTVTRTE